METLAQKPRLTKAPKHLSVHSKVVRMKDRNNQAYLDRKKCGVLPLPLSALQCRDPIARPAAPCPACEYRARLRYGVRNLAPTASRRARDRAQVLPH
jgi:hypothetical protein